MTSPVETAATALHSLANMSSRHTESIANASLPSTRVPHKRFDAIDDLLLLREVNSQDPLPFMATKGMLGKAWEQVANNLDRNVEFKKVSPNFKNCQARFNTLLETYESDSRVGSRESGIEEERSEKDDLLQDLLKQSNEWRDKQQQQVATKSTETIRGEMAGAMTEEPALSCLKRKRDGMKEECLNDHDPTTPIKTPKSRKVPELDRLITLLEGNSGEASRAAIGELVNMIVNWADEGSGNRSENARIRHQLEMQERRRDREVMLQIHADVMKERIEVRKMNQELFLALIEKIPGSEKAQSRTISKRAANVD